MAVPSAGKAYGPLPKFPNFKVHRLLGRGSYGKVYKVERESDQQLYALKEADLGSMSQAERADAVNEVRLLVSIAHVNVIRYHEAFLLGNKLCTVMEYAPCGDLRYYISKGRDKKTPFPEEAIWRLLLQLCKGVQALHSQNIIHRDIKPANIFLCPNDLLKIGDLGIAKALTNMHFAKTQIGTPCYMAPEVWSGRPYSYSSDMWSVGAVLYEMMTFRTPMDGRNMVELRNRIMGGRYVAIPEGRYSPELVSLCYSLLNTEPSRRPSPSAILASAAAGRWMHVLPDPGNRPPARRWTSDGSASKNLLDTIIVPRDLKQLPKRLPPPSYDSDAAKAAAAAPPGGQRVASWSAGVAPSSAPSARPPPVVVPSYSAPNSKAPTPVGLPLSKPPTPTGQPASKPPTPTGQPVPRPSSVMQGPRAPSREHSRAPSPVDYRAPAPRAPSRENSRAPSPMDIRAFQDNRKGAVAAALPPLFPRSGLSAAAAAAAAAAYQQRWAPNVAAFAFNAARVLPPRRVSYS